MRLEDLLETVWRGLGRPLARKPEMYLVSVVDPSKDDGLMECPACGTGVQEESVKCHACGVRFESEADRTPREETSAYAATIHNLTAGGLSRILSYPGLPLFKEDKWYALSRIPRGSEEEFSDVVHYNSKTDSFADSSGKLHFSASEALFGRARTALRGMPKPINFPEFDVRRSAMVIYVRDTGLLARLQRISHGSAEYAPIHELIAAGELETAYSQLIKLAIKDERDPKPVEMLATIHESLGDRQTAEALLKLDVASVQVKNART